MDFVLCTQIQTECPSNPHHTLRLNLLPPSSTVADARVDLAQDLSGSAIFLHGFAGLHWLRGLQLLSAAGLECAL